jgi:hypothetical protein
MLHCVVCVSLHIEMLNFLSYLMSLYVRVEMTTTISTLKRCSVRTCLRREAVPSSYQTPAILLIYTVNTCWTPLYATHTNNINKTRTNGDKVRTEHRFNVEIVVVISTRT